MWKDMLNYQESKENQNRNENNNILIARRQKEKDVLIAEELRPNVHLSTYIWEPMNSQNYRTRTVTHTYLMKINIVMENDQFFVWIVIFFWNVFLKLLL